MRIRPLIAAGLFTGAGLPHLFAPPPLLTGDVPTAGEGGLELYTGVRYQDTGRIERQLPHIELVYGLTERWELSAEANFLSREGPRGFDDVTVATKFVLLMESPTRPGVGASYEYKFDNGDANVGLGSGGIEHDLRLRAQKTFGRFTPMINVGFVAVPDARIAGRVSARQDVRRMSFAQEWKATANLHLLAEGHSTPP